MGNVTISVEPTVEPVTTAEIKAQLKEDLSDEDALIAAYGKAARLHIEQATGRQLVQATIQEQWEAFPDALRRGFIGGSHHAQRSDDLILSRGPVRSVSSITYLDNAGNSQTWGASLYQTDLNAVPARIRPAYGQSYPSTHANALAGVTVTYIAGYPASDDSPANLAKNVPDDFKFAIKLLAAFMFENRAGEGGSVPKFLMDLVAKHRIFLF